VGDDTSPDPSIDPLWFRRILGQVPTAVTVVTASTAEGPAGMVVGTFVSISLNPALVGMFLDGGSSSWPRIEQAGSFTANVLADDQRDLCARFARRGGDKFEGLTWTKSSLGNPVLPGVTGWIDCRLQEVHEIGDHVLAVGRVVDLGAAGERLPLVFHRGGLHTLRPLAVDGPNGDGRRPPVAGLREYDFPPGPMH